MIKLVWFAQSSVLNEIIVKSNTYVSPFMNES